MPNAAAGASVGNIVASPDVPLGVLVAAKSLAPPKGVLLPNGSADGANGSEAPKSLDPAVGAN